MSAVVTVIDLLDGHVQLDIKCLDRIYLNGYVPNLQVAGQVVMRLPPNRGGIGYKESHAREAEKVRR